MNAETISEILAMWDADQSVATIASELGISAQGVRNVLRSGGKDLNRVVVTSKEKEAVSAYVSGVSVPEILQKYGLTYSKLYTALAHSEVPLRRTVEAPGRKEALERALILYQEGAPLWKIKAETGIAQPTLHSELHIRNIPLRRPR